jgi:hypothetical protein
MKSGSTAGLEHRVMPAVLTDGQGSECAPTIAPDVDADATEPRAGLIDDVIDELRWTLKGRKGWLLGLAANLALAVVVVGYEHHAPHVSGDIKIAHIGVAVVIYVLAGTLATNQLGSDADRVINSLERRNRVSRILALKNV